MKLFVAFGRKSTRFPYDPMMHETLFPATQKYCGDQLLLGNLVEIMKKVYQHNLYDKS